MMRQDRSVRWIYFIRSPSLAHTYRAGVTGCNSCGNLRSYCECIFPAAALKLHKEGVGVAINHPGSPRRMAVDHVNRILKGLVSYKRRREKLVRDVENNQVLKTRSENPSPLCTMVSASSAKGILPEKEAEVYPYVTLDIILRPN